jgi:apolipoprotein N-acyltransferase
VSSPGAPSAKGTAWIAASLLLWVVSFAPDPQPWGVIPGFVGTLWLIERCATTASFLRWSLIFGALGIGFGYLWLADTIQLFGGLPLPVAWLLTALFGVVGVAHGWVFALIYRSMLDRGVRPHPLLVAALWVACESYVPRLFPWMAGHGVVEVPGLRQLAEFGGVPLVSFATLCLVAPLHEALRWALPIAGRPEGRLKPAAVTLAVGALLFVVGHLRHDSVRASEREATEHWAVGVVQPNVGSLDKRAAEERRQGAHDAGVQAYDRGSKRAAERGAELIVWPETAVTESIAYTSQAPQHTAAQLEKARYSAFRELGDRHDFLIGAYEKKEPPPDEQRLGHAFDERWNTAALRPRGGREARWSTVRKVHLIPFGEYMPFGLPRSLLPQRFTMVAGDSPQPLLELGGRTLLPFLCYEGILPEHVREAAGDRRPTLLVSLANDSWFGDTWEPWQHLHFTRFRAVEHGAPLVRATNTGVSAFVSAAGDVEALLGVGVEDVLVHDVPLVERGRTLYASGGHHLPLLLALAALGAWLFVVLGPSRR